MSNRLLSFLLIGAIAIAIGACATPAVQDCGASGVVCPSGYHCAVAEGFCVPNENKCGDLITDVGEACDDGNRSDGDGCAADCSSTEVCGNRIRDTKFKDSSLNEVCDDGNTNPNDGCSADCKSEEVCGNGITDQPVKRPDGSVDVTIPRNEACDDGNHTNGDGCSADCKSTERCGNGITDPAAGEICDLVPQDLSRCSADCKSSLDCGNAIVDPGEECDLGMSVNSFDGDCRPDCVINRCGDGYTNSNEAVGHAGEHKEACDAAPPAAENSRVTNPTQSATCNVDCSAALCGDGKVNRLNIAAPATADGEFCDDGNRMDGDGCDNNCKVTGCGNGITTGSEACDDGNQNNGDGCDNNCKATACGNGILTTGEFCDDGNRDNDDGCSSTCVIERCGDGVDNNRTEQCDTGTISATCNADCTTAACGDGKINDLFTPAGAPGTEQCDDGNILNDDGCSSACQFERCGDGVENNVTELCDTAGNSQTCNADCTQPRCGDGKLNPNFTPLGAAGPEQCDDGGIGPNDGCSPTCQFERCGNNIIDPGEQCDGSPVGGFACFRCHQVKCGDGFLDASFGEQCDDGNNVATDDCVSNQANPTTCKVATCGDSVRNSNREECDNGASNGAVGNTCSATCHNVTCGNGIIEQGETCDDGPPISNNGNGKSCNAACHRNVCGDTDKLNGIEQCDEGLDNTATCDSDCTLPVCGDGFLNTDAGETCDNGILNGTQNNPCNLFCRSRSCGNNLIDFGEACDPGTPNTNVSTCDRDCTAPVCGDGLINGAAGETCDDGANNGNPCAYGDPNCTRCSSTCQGLVSPGGPKCGDNTVNGPEVCDQGVLNGGQCRYGDVGVGGCLAGSASTVCSAGCSAFIANPNGKFCGDNIVSGEFNEQCDPSGGIHPVDTPECDNDCSLSLCGDGHLNLAALEVCDDGNTNACGSCNATCSVVTLTEALGQIRVDITGGAQLTSHETFTLNDGINLTATTFEFLKGTDEAGAGHIGILIDNADTAEEIRDFIVAAINGQIGTLLIGATATDIGPIHAINLKHDRKTARGNQTLDDGGVAIAGFQITGMAGGLGGDCPTNTRCKSNNDCFSGVCTAAGRCAP